VTLKAPDGSNVDVCVTSDKPLDFIFETETNSYNIAGYDTDEKLVKKVQTGKGDAELYSGSRYIYIDGLFASTVPDTIE